MYLKKGTRGLQVVKNGTLTRFSLKMVQPHNNASLVDASADLLISLTSGYNHDCLEGLRLSSARKQMNMSLSIDSP